MLEISTLTRKNIKTAKQADLFYARTSNRPKPDGKNKKVVEKNDYFFQNIVKNHWSFISIIILYHNNIKSRVTIKVRYHFYFLRFASNFIYPQT